MINHTEPFLPPLEDDIDMEVALATVKAPFLDLLIDQKVWLLKLHLLQHVTGLDKTEEHTRTCEQINEVSADIDRGYNSLWN